MKRFIIAALALAAIFPSTALARTSKPTPRQAGVYEYLRHKAEHKYGSRSPGRDILIDGLQNGQRASSDDIKASIKTLQRMIWPPPVMPRVRQLIGTPAIQHSSNLSGCSGNTPYSGGGQCWAIPYSVVLCESGARNVPNSGGSGADGYYQLMSGGGGSRAEQDAAAARLWNHGVNTRSGLGPSNWTCR